MNTSQQEKPIWEQEARILAWKNMVEIHFDTNEHPFCFTCPHCHSSLVPKRGLSEKDAVYVCTNCNHTVPQEEIDNIMRVFPKIP